MPTNRTDNTDTSRITRKTWLITGASSGFGRLMTQRLLARGDRVVGTARNTHALDDLKQEYGDQLDVVWLDLTETNRIRRVMAEAFSRMGRIDVIVSNAGYGLFGAAEELTDEQVDKQIGINLVGSIQLIRSVLPHLREQGGGRILQMSSEGGQIAYPNFSLYHASKWGIEGFVESVAQEVAGFGIEFVIAESGPTDTNFAANLAHAEPLAAYEGTPADMVRRALDDGSFAITGDAERTVSAMTRAADDENPELRLVLGSTAYDNMSGALTHRLQTVQSQREVAYSADRDE